MASSTAMMVSKITVLMRPKRENNCLISGTEFALVLNRATHVKRVRPLKRMTAVCQPLFVPGQGVVVTDIYEKV
jgi:hypothetical protein